jgi:uncharacterized ferritin-like protein (DUF455 family)
MTDLHAAARRCLDATDPAEKLRLTDETWQAFLAGELRPDPASPPPAPIGPPGRPARPLLVNARQVPQRGLGSAEGRAALVHAVAHIEFNAINLAWDAVYRYRGKPDAYYRDWASCAHDEARHFALLCGRLAELGHAYGDFDAHDGLWAMAEKTAHHDTARMALVPRVLEARGLDVTPGMIDRLRQLGDTGTVAILEGRPRRGRHALVPVLLRTRRRRTGRYVLRVVARLHGGQPARAIQSTGPAAGGFCPGGTGSLDHVGAGGRLAAQRRPLRRLRFRVRPDPTRR